MKSVKKPINIFVAKMFQLYIKPKTSKKIYIKCIDHGKTGSNPVSTLTQSSAFFCKSVKLPNKRYKIAFQMNLYLKKVL